jgi:hypothetical protein
VGLPLALPVGVLLLALMMFTAVQMRFPDLFGEAASFLDFHVFYLVGQFGWDGAVETAYYADQFHAVQSAQRGFVQFLPYSYPPHANFLTLGLAALPDWLAYLAFMGSTVAGLYLVLRRLAPGYAADALILSAPAVFVAIRSGQNGPLTAALIGLVCLWWGRRGAAGLPLGLVTFKPHLALGLGLAVLLRLRIRLALVTITIGVALGSVATWVFGGAVWGHFLNGARETTAFLDAGLFPFDRMASVYALLRTSGLSAEMAMGVHMLVALVAFGVTGAACLRGWDARRMLAVSVAAGLMVSPYLYDYDTAALAVAVALAGPELACASARLRGALISGVVLAGSAGLLHQNFAAYGVDVPLAFGGVGLVLAFGALTRAVALAEQGDAGQGLSVDETMAARPVSP